MRFAASYAPRYRAAALAAILAGSMAVSALRAEVMPAMQQNALVQKYCAVCHTDAANNGGLSLERFDVAQAAPSLTAMLLSKLTGGVSLETVSEVPSNPSAAALVDRNTKSGAMGAAGIPVPSKATIAAFIRALAVESAGADRWAVRHTAGAAASAPVTVASILREWPSAKNAGEARAFRLVISCDAAARRGFMQVAWSPVPQRGTLAASVDGDAVVSYQVEGSEKMGNHGVAVTDGLAALVLSDTKEDAAGLPLPDKSLTIKDLFPGEAVVFPFEDLPRDARQEFQACFADIPKRRPLRN